MGTGEREMPGDGEGKRDSQSRWKEKGDEGGKGEGDTHGGGRLQGIRFPRTSFVLLSPLSFSSFLSFFRCCRSFCLAGAHHPQDSSRSGQDGEMEEVEVH